MHPFRILSLLMAATLALFAAAALQADERNDPVSAQDFVEEASAKGIAEIEVGRLALEKSTSQEVKTFAQRMIDDHTKANEKLAALASEKKLEVSDDAELINQAKALVLKLRGEASFDKAYMNNQVAAHQQTIALFQRASRSDDAEIAAFATETLPKLEHHLQQAQQVNEQIPGD